MDMLPLFHFIGKETEEVLSFAVYTQGFLVGEHLWLCPGTVGNAGHRLRTLGEDGQKGGGSSCGKTLLEPSGPTEPPPPVDSVGLLSALVE